MSRKNEHTIPEIDQELERLQNLGILGRDFLKDVYKDFYGSPEEAGKKPAGPDPSAAKGPADAQLPSAGQSAVENGAAPSGDRRTEGGAAAPGKSPEAQGKAAAPVKSLEAEGKAAEPAQEAPAPELPEEDPLEALDNLIGLTKIKQDVRELTDFVRIQKLRKEQGLKSVPVSLHLVFTGNPGTGKTTVARILSRIYKKIGVLSKGQLVEVDRSGLVAGYVGQTAIKTQEQIEKALGGVLFIDEAYTLAQKDDAFGQEAIDTILKAMEDHRDDLVVIVAGYTEPMEKFINSNPGLKSRFNKYIEFPDYSVDELMAIFEQNCKKYDYILSEDVRKHIRELLVARQLKKPENFANAREVRNLFEEIITNQAHRVAEHPSPSQMDMMTITLEDLEETMKEPEKDSTGKQGKDTTGKQEKETSETPVKETTKRPVKGPGIK